MKTFIGLISLGRYAIKAQFGAKMLVLDEIFSKWSVFERFFSMYLDLKHAQILRVSQHVEPRMHILRITARLDVFPGIV